MSALVCVVLVLLAASSSRPAAGAVALVVTDAAAPAGLAQTTSSYGAVFADVSGDGIRDVLLNRHWQRSMQLFLGRSDGTFALGATFATSDRHGCGVADVTADGRNDIYCAEGASNASGSVVKANDLFVQRANGTFADGARGMGVDDPYGRGRDVAVVEANGDAFPDLFVGNVGGRTDGQPSHNRLFLNDGGTGFHDSLDPDIAAMAGAHCAIARDVNGDGRQDLLVCGAGKAGGPLALFRNDAGTGYTNVTTAAGLRVAGLGAALADLNRDGRLDVVAVSWSGVRVQFSTAPGRFGRVWTVAGGGADLAVADADRDGDLDVFVVRGCAAKRDQGDMLLVNRGWGGFDAMGLAPAAGGCGDAVTAMTYRGQAAFLVLNGHGASAGPVQLLTFRR